MKDYKVLMAPVNISGQPKMLVEGLIELGVNARLFQYGKHKFGYASDIVVDLTDKNRTQAQLESLSNMIEMDFDIFHFWFRTFYYGSYYNGFPGFDLPIIKSAGKKIMYRFTGYDLRMSSLEKEVNPWHAYQYGFEPLFDEVEQRKYLEYLSEFVDRFIVQDVEMESYMIAAGLPQPTIIPRSINLNDWPYYRPKKTSKPLVIHAPSKSVVKGTPFILDAVEELLAEGLSFDFKLIQNMSHQEAKTWYEKSDLAIDQILIGWYGVFSMECMALGKPVIVYIRDDLIEKSAVKLPCLNANPSNIKSVLKKAILDHDLRDEISLKQRQYVEQVHDVEKVAVLMKACYEDVLDQPDKPISVTNVIPHMEHQMRKYTDSSVQSVFLKQKSGVSFNQDHELFIFLKRLKRKKSNIFHNIRNKRSLIRSVFSRFFHK